MAFKLPRLNALVSIANSKGQPTNTFLRWWNMEVAPAIEQQITDLAKIVSDIQALQSQQALQLELINQALELAGIAIGLAGGNTGTATATIDLSGVTWVPGPQVDLTGVVAGDVTISSSGLYPDSGTTFNQVGERFGSVRLIEIDGMTEAVIGGPWNMKVERDELFGTVFVLNAPELNTFTLARTNTGTIGYRLEYNMTEPADLLENVPAKMFVRRSV